MQIHSAVPCLFAESPIAILSPLKDTAILEDKPLVLECEVSKPGVPSTWLKNGKEIKPDEREGTTSKTDGRRHSLSVDNASPGDAGQYSLKIGETVTTGKVTVKGSFEESLFLCFLQKCPFYGCLAQQRLFGNVYCSLCLSEAPLTVIKPLKDSRVSEEKPVVLECEVSKPDAPSKWLKDGKPVKSDGKAVTAKTEGRKHSLTLAEVKPSDSGQYSVELKGAKSSCKLAVIGWLNACIFHVG